MPKTVGVLIGRFQLPQLHDGHTAIINHVLKNCDETCILVGVTPKPDLKNLLPYPAVRQMIRGTYAASYAAGKLHIHPLLDIDGNDLQWSYCIDRLLTLLFPGYVVHLYSGRDSFKPHYHGKYQPVIDWYGFNGEINGTKERNRIIESNPADCASFRAGIVYGLGNYLKKHVKQWDLGESEPE